MISLGLLNSTQDMIRVPQENLAIGCQECSEFHHHITSLTRRFPGYALHELSNANLMHRFDTKYLLSMCFLPEILARLQLDYAILDIDHCRIFTYQNIYFDTEHFQFYYMHHNGQLNRFKVRHRKYLETKTNFLEVKFKNNRQRTIKHRMKISTETDQDMTEEMTYFLQQQLSGTVFNLHPKQWVRYRRITLANEQREERVTLDFCLSFQPTEGEFLYTLEGLLIAELKQARKNMASPFFDLMRQHHLRPMSFSKYCMGCCLTYFDKLKINNFKPKLLKIQQYSVIRKDYAYA